METKTSLIPDPEAATEEQNDIRKGHFLINNCIELEILSIGDG